MYPTITKEAIFLLKITKQPWCLSSAAEATKTTLLKSNLLLTFNTTLNYKNTTLNLLHTSRNKSIKLTISMNLKSKGLFNSNPYSTYSGKSLARAL